MSAGHGTGYAETEALLSVMDDDEDAALTTLADMSAGERMRLLDAIGDLAALIRTNFR